jgi:hypothetical protein
LIPTAAIAPSQSPSATTSAKHNRYSTDEAQETIAQLKQGSVKWQDLFWGQSEVERRRALKDLSQHLPFRPFLRWLYMYFILGGIWDGKAGFAWCTLQAFYEYLILLKVEEIKAIGSTSTDKKAITSQQPLQIKVLQTSMQQE